MELVTIFHVLCSFVTFCAGGTCSAYEPFDANLRFQDGREIGEFWTAPEFALLPWPALVVQGGETFDRRTHFFISGEMSGTYLISLAPDMTSATLTMHLLTNLGDSNATSASSEGTCTRLEGQL